jgi:hypothetical protein
LTALCNLIEKNATNKILLKALPALTKVCAQDDNVAYKRALETLQELESESESESESEPESESESKEIKSMDTSSDEEEEEMGMEAPPRKRAPLSSLLKTGPKKKTKKKKVCSPLLVCFSIFKNAETKKLKNTHLSLVL